MNEPKPAASGSVAWEVAAEQLFTICIEVPPGSAAMHVIQRACESHAAQLERERDEVRAKYEWKHAADVRERESLSFQVQQQIKIIASTQEKSRQLQSELSGNEVIWSASRKRAEEYANQIDSLRAQLAEAKAALSATVPRVTVERALEKFDAGRAYARAYAILFDAIKPSTRASVPTREPESEVKPYQETPNATSAEAQPEPKKPTTKDALASNAAQSSDPITAASGYTTRAPRMACDPGTGFVWWEQETCNSATIYHYHQ